MRFTGAILAAIYINPEKKTMTYDQLLKHFKTQVAAAKALKISQPAVSNWSKRGIPAMQQVKINKITKGALKLDKGIL